MTQPATVILADYSVEWPDLFERWAVLFVLDEGEVVLPQPPAQAKVTLSQKAY